MKKIESPCIYIVGTRIGLAPILEWLSDECGVFGDDVIAVFDDGDFQSESVESSVLQMTYSMFDQRVSERDVVIVTRDDFAEIVAELIARGCHNVFDGQSIMRRSGGVRRVLIEGGPYHLGANAPSVSLEEKREFRHYSSDAVSARSIPGHLLFVVNSMPKSGTLWMIAILEDLLGVKAKQQITVSHVRDIESDWPKQNNHGAVALVRDIRDVVVSWFHHLARLDLQNGFATSRYYDVEQFYFEYFIGRVCGSERFYFGDLDRWLNYIGANSIPLVRYEDMIADTFSAIRRVMTFWKVDIADQELRRAVRRCEFQKMQETGAEKEGYVSGMLRSGHLRQGCVGTWKEELGTRIVDDISVRFSHYQQRLDYQ